jgi:pilus retraction protein PilT
MPYQTELIVMRLLAGKRELADRLARTGLGDLSYSLARRTRFRVNVFAQRGSYSVVLRVIPNKVPTVEELGCRLSSSEISERAQRDRAGNGPDGSGKSTTLAAIINQINREQAIHIITIEDPIEYLHPHQAATINQREVGTDTQTFALALRAALRQAPKVILVGEMRDVETISIALEASETGTWSSPRSTPSTPRRPWTGSSACSRRTRSARSAPRFSQSFKWIVSQRLVPRNGGGRMAVCEVLRSTSRTKEYIQEGERDGKSLIRRHERRRPRRDAELRSRARAPHQRGSHRPRDGPLLRDEPHQPHASTGDTRVGGARPGPPGQAHAGSRRVRSWNGDVEVGARRPHRAVTMQASCPQCGNRVAIDDAKVPDKPFQVKCPQCQTPSGSRQGERPMPYLTAAPQLAVREPAAAAAEAMAPIRARDAAVAASRAERASAGGRQALIALPDRA